VSGEEEGEEEEGEEEEGEEEGEEEEGEEEEGEEGEEGEEEEGEEGEEEEGEEEEGDYEEDGEVEEQPLPASDFPTFSSPLDLIRSISYDLDDLSLFIDKIAAKSAPYLPPVSIYDHDSVREEEPEIPSGAATLSLPRPSKETLSDRVQIEDLYRHRGTEEPISLVKSSKPRVPGFKSVAPPYY